ncbi:MAG: DUF1501 domain-containing protein [Planctomycetes bacterium]|nr:DUF1501 domain-containing protein [Planctomycetota bacterium]
MDPRLEQLRLATRRQFLRAGATGVGALALGTLLRGEQGGLPHFAPRARRVIFLHMAGAPSALDLFDNKPELVRLNGQPISEELIQNERFAFIKGVPTVLGSPYRFARHGQCGHELSELLPHLATVADRIALVRSMKTTQFNHAPAQVFLNTGFERAGRPSMGSWLSYGLGSENANLPAFVVLLSGRYSPDGGAACWSSGFLPSVHQGVRFRSQGDAVLFLSNPPGVDSAGRRRQLDALAELNQQRHAATLDPEIETRIAQYELAYRMQSAVPELLEIESEPEAVRALYGAEPGKQSFANNCLLARRLVERGVRFVQLYHWGWDSHGTSPDDDIVSSLPRRCQETDRASAALIHDLERRGLLEDTLVVWGGEFGRTPMNEARNGSTFLGRDHHPHCFTIWMAGGGVKGGVAHGQTDELGYHVAADPVTVNDLHATMLHLFGIEHAKFTYRFQGRDFRLTDVAGEVVAPLLA